ncbi:MAG: hypothetical protein GYA55_03815 [SAR324 cluster bacterium]|uniref:Uncharacterized protein n=1 Tax=SAR324 cluster bacterium TaxID=2024889 RepID=A0A7X9FR29_9DELT|nr:hypothetical protein [SAR324 cluster bacterium]
MKNQPGLNFSITEYNKAQSEAINIHAAIASRIRRTVTVLSEINCARIIERDEVISSTAIAA